MKRTILAIGLVLSFSVFIAFAMAQDPGDPVPLPSILVEWNGDGNMLAIDSVPELTLVSYQVVQAAAGSHSYNFIVDSTWPKQMKWECTMPESTPTNPVKLEMVLELTGLPSVNPSGRWWAKMRVQVVLALNGVTGPASEISDTLYCIDWVEKKTGKPKRTMP